MFIYISALSVETAEQKQTMDECKLSLPFERGDFPGDFICIKTLLDLQRPGPCAQSGWCAIKAEYI